MDPTKAIRLAMMVAKGVSSVTDKPLFKKDGGEVDAAQSFLPTHEREANKAKFLEASKIKDRMYHATHSDFNKFQNNFRGVHFLTPDTEFANNYLTDSGQDEHEEGANIMPLHVHAKNPFDYENPKHVNALATKASLGKLAIDQIKEGNWSRIEDRTTLKAIKSLGHDGVYVNECGVKNLGVFNSKQIKSAIGNRGTYDLNSSDITKANGGEVDDDNHNPISENDFRSDIPSESWLKEKIEDSGKYGVNKYGAPKNLGKGTGFIRKNVLLPVSLLKTFKGQSGEQSNVRSSSIDYLISHMDKTKKLPPSPDFSRKGSEYVPYIEIASDGTPWVNEGNHRIMAADKLGWSHLPVELRYYNGGERSNGPLHPSRVVQMHNEAVEKGVKRANGGEVDDDSLLPQGQVQQRKVSPIGFYSPAADAAANLPQESGTPEQMAAMLAKSRGVTDEMQHSGYAQKMTTPKVSKQDLVGHFESEMPDVQETVLGEKPQKSRVPTVERELAARAIYNWARESGEDTETILNGISALGDGDPSGLQDLEQLNVPESLLRPFRNEANTLRKQINTRTKYHDPKYQLPSGENYREVLLRLPASATQYAYDAFNPQTQTSRQFNSREEAAAFANKDETGQTVVSEIGVVKPDYHSPHWDQPNVLAHIRLNDRTDKDGKKVLFVEEIQSDWGQEGREKGFAGALTDADKARLAEIIAKEKAGTSTEQDIREWGKLQDKKSGAGIPAAPFVDKTDKWLNLALKRITKMAVDGGYDKVAFVNGNQSADRYDLSKKVGSVHYFPEGDGVGKGTLVAMPIGSDINSSDEVAMSHDNVAPEDLEKHVGKDVAKSLLSSPKTNGRHTVAGEGLKVGGEGMKTFYDKIVPAAVNKLLPRIKGKKLETVHLTNQPHDDKVSFHQPGFEVTPEMREHVKKGLPLFKRGGLVTKARGGAIAKSKGGKILPIENFLDSQTGEVTKKAQAGHSSIKKRARETSLEDLDKMSRDDLISWLKKTDPNGIYDDPEADNSWKLEPDDDFGKVKSDGTIHKGWVVHRYDVDEGEHEVWGKYNDRDEAFKNLNLARYNDAEFPPLTHEEALNSAKEIMKETMWPAESAKVISIGNAKKTEQKEARGGAIAQIPDEAFKNMRDSQKAIRRAMMIARSMKSNGGPEFGNLKDTYHGTEQTTTGAGGVDSEAESIPDATRLRGSEGVLSSSREALSRGALEGLPQHVKIPVTGASITAAPDDKVRAVAEQYMASTGRAYRPPTRYAKVDPKRAKRIAAAYDQMQHNPDHPLTKAAYAALADEVMAQYKAAKDAGFKAEFWDPVKEKDPYHASPRLAVEDVRNNHHMFVFPTRVGFGTDPFTAEELQNNPLLADSGERWNGHPVFMNDLFRAVHDYYGHAKEGVGFRADGEENAWRAHMSMFSPLARLAATSETRGQNSWLNYGPHGDHNRTARTEDTHFADQKTGILPPWVMHEGAEDFLHPDEVMEMYKLYRHHKASGGSVGGNRRMMGDGGNIETKDPDLFDMSSLHEVPKVSQFDLPRYMPARGVSPRVADVIKNKKVLGKMIDVVQKGRQMGGERWYNAEPLRQEFVAHYGQTNGNNMFRKYMDMVAATSPRSDVGTNVRNSSYYFKRLLSGQGVPDIGERNPQPYGHLAQKLHQMNAQRVATTGWDPLNNPKPASFVENLTGNQTPVTVDTHAFRLPGILSKDPRFLLTNYQASAKSPKLNIKQLVESGQMSMKDALQTPAYWDAAPRENEYGALEKYYQDKIAKELGISPAATQASAWVGGGDLTGLASDESKPFMGFFQDRIYKTARDKDMDPKDVLKHFIEGKISLLSSGGFVDKNVIKKSVEIAKTIKNFKS